MQLSHIIQPRITDEKKKSRMNVVCYYLKNNPLRGRDPQVQELLCFKEDGWKNEWCIVSSSVIIRLVNEVSFAPSDWPIKRLSAPVGG
ncbi:hypothetical protein TNCV_3849241 [Trichonephila clavipes]|uniref:Uncharacterized protein n=1 Tax=Trichonephila clavipes TaxID=2585209 RepID=A0A8X6RD16_TRICX|nr:hypothetical protein TNCV_3849241 [Trichonephila clavipes]